jgi:hypothetical protein
MEQEVTSGECPDVAVWAAAIATAMQKIAWMVKGGNLDLMELRRVVAAADAARQQCEDRCS